MLAEGSAVKNVDSLFSALANEVKRDGDMLVKGWQKKLNPKSGVKDQMLINNYMDPKGLFSKFRTKPDTSSMRELREWLEGMKRDAPEITTTELVKMIKDGKNLFNNPKTAKIVEEAMRKDLLVEVLAFGGVSGFMGAVTETAHQIGTFDFKSQVMDGKNGMPNYDLDKAQKDTLLSAGFGFVFGGVFSLGANLMGKNADEMAAMVGTGSAKDGTKVDIHQSIADIKNSKNPDGTIDSVEPIDISEIPDFEKRSQEALDEIETINSTDPELTKGSDFDEFNINKQEESKWQAIADCALPDAPTNKGIPTPGRPMRTPNTKNDPEKSHTKIVNVNTGVDDAFQARAMTGRMNAWKDEAITGLRNKYTYDDAYKALGVKGFSKQEQDNIIGHLYNAKSGKEFKQVLKNMQIDDLLE